MRKKIVLFTIVILISHCLKKENKEINDFNLQKKYLKLKLLNAIISEIYKYGKK